MTNRMRTVLAVVFVVVVFAAGVVVGLGVGRHGFGHRFGMGPHGGPPRIFGELKDALALDAAQAAEVEKILTEERAAAQATFATSIERGRQRIRAVLRPEQVAEFEKWIAAHPRPPGPPGGPGGGPGDGPPPPPPPPFER